MKSYTSDIFLELKEKVVLAKKRGSNILVYTFVGSGSTHYLKELAKEDKELTYINSVGMEMGSYNILDLPLSEAVLYVNKVDVKQKYLLLVKSGMDFHSSVIKNISDHLYVNFPLGAGCEEDIRDMMVRFGHDKNSSLLKEIMNQSGGIPKLAKYLMVNEAKAEGEVYEKLVKGITDSVVGYSPSEMNQLGLVDEKGEIRSDLLKKYVGKAFDIKINFDLSFEEKGVLSKENLTALEAEIVRKMIEGGGKISKEEVSNIKWGEGKYDEYSDQAINKQMRRLSQKLKKFSIKTIPKVGFELQ